MGSLSQVRLPPLILNLKLKNSVVNKSRFFFDMNNLSYISKVKDSLGSKVKVDSLLLYGGLPDLLYI